MQSILWFADFHRFVFVHEQFGDDTYTAMELLQLTLTLLVLQCSTTSALAISEPWFMHLHNLGNPKSKTT